MKIITLWQPWASLVALGLKQYETRSWQTAYRGRLAIHAAKRPFVSGDGSKTLDRAAWQAWIGALTLAHDTGILTDESRVPLAHQLPLGRIVAIADLTDCEQMLPSTIQSKSKLEQAVGDWEFYRYAWRLEGVVALKEPIPFKGAQGLRKLEDAAVLQAIATQQSGGVA